MEHYIKMDAFERDLYRIAESPKVLTITKIYEKWITKIKTEGKENEI